MNKYKCSCGGQLELRQEVVYCESNKVLFNGKLSKKKNIWPIGVYGVSWLQCIVCNKEYEYEPLGNDRWCKGTERI